MQTTTNHARYRAAFWIVVLPTAMLLLGGCIFFGPIVRRDAVDMDPFKEMAKTSSCSDVHNRLFLIDDQLVFWDIAGNCDDAAYSQMLFDGTPEQMLCRSNDSIAGPMKTCWDDRYRDMFDTITANLDQPDLGLGPEHTVEPVSF